LIKTYPQYYLILCNYFFGRWSGYRNWYVKCQQRPYLLSQDQRNNGRLYDWCSFRLGRIFCNKNGKKNYGITILVPKCKIAGEVNNTILYGYSCKGHEGYLRNAVIAVLCRLYTYQINKIKKTAALVMNRKNEDSTV